MEYTKISDFRIEFAAKNATAIADIYEAGDDVNNWNCSRRTP